MTAIRVNWTLEPRAFNILEKAAKHSRKSRSSIICQLIYQKLQNPIEALKEEKRQLYIKINEIDDKIKHLEKLKDEKT